jgi:hypothetical protein
VAKFEFALQAMNCPVSHEPGGVGGKGLGHLSLFINIGDSNNIMVYVLNQIKQSFLN